MSIYEEQIDRIREYFEEHKAERYPFENAMLSEKDEYLKALYFRMLCALICYTGEPNEMQSLYVRRLIAGAHAENEFPDYMRMAWALERSDIDEFVSAFRNDDLKYYFCIDGTILLSVVKAPDKHYELLAELIEMLGIDPAELRYLVSAARAIVLQSTELFDEAKALLPDSIRSLSLYHYVANFYTGEIVNTPEEMHIYSCDRANVDFARYSAFRARRVIIENISSALTMGLLFDGCEEVMIRKCKLVGDKHCLTFKRVGKVTIEDCETSDFTARFAYFDGINQAVLSGNSFRNCGCSSKDSIKGGVFYCNETDSVIFENNEFQNCYVALSAYRLHCVATGILLDMNTRGKRIDVQGNRFIGCECRNNGSSSPAAYITGPAETKTEKDNVCTGPVNRIFY